MLSREQKIKLADENPARLYMMLLDESAKAEVKYISKAAQDFMNGVREKILEYIDLYKEDYGEHWQEVFESDWQGLYAEILDGQRERDNLLEYFRNLL